MRRAVSPDEGMGQKNFRTTNKNNFIMNDKIDTEVYMAGLRLRKEVLWLQANARAVEWFRGYFLEGERYCTPIDVEDAFRNYRETVGKSGLIIDTAESMVYLLARICSCAQWACCTIEGTKCVVIEPRGQKKSE